MNDNYIPKIIAACGISKGELVLVHFWGEDTDKSLANHFVSAVAALGATPVLLQQARSINRMIFLSVTDDAFDDRYFDSLSHFDTVLDIFAYQPIILGYELSPEQQARYRHYISRLFSALMKAKRFLQIRMPTETNAAESSMEPAEYIRRMEHAYDLDYPKLLTNCQSKKQELEQWHSYTLKSGNCHALHFDLIDRFWHIDAGDGDWPCGEIYIAPNENHTHGTVWFEHLFLEETGNFHHVTLTVENGHLVSSDHPDVDAFIHTLSPENTVVCELGFGMNPNIFDLCGYTVLDEKMAGTFHIAIGANTMFGGQNHASIHMDLVGSGPFTLIPDTGGPKDG